MDTPGTLLRSEREKQKKSLNDIEKVLKINIEYLRAIENDNYQQLPADLFAKSYLRSYSAALGLEADHILSLYNKYFREPSMIPQPPKKPLRNMLSGFKTNHIYILLICVSLVTIFVITYTKLNTDKPSFITVDKAIPITGAEEIKIETAAVEKAIPEEPLSLKIAASELTWISIMIDSANAEELLLRSGESTTVTAHEKFVLKIGNAGGTSLILNGTNIGKLGPHGQVVDIVLP